MKGGKLIFKMKKCFYVALALLCSMTISGCGKEVPQDSRGVYRQEASNPSGETAPLDVGTGKPSDTSSNDIDPASTTLIEETRSIPTSIATYLSAAEELLQSDDPYDDGGIIFQGQEVNLEKDYNCEIILPEDFAETWNFTFSLSVDGTPDNLYELEGNRDYASIVFGEAYKLGNTLYIGTGLADELPFALNLETKTLTDCKKEYETMESLFSDWIQAHQEDMALRIWYCYPTACVDDCLMYKAVISEGMDTDTRAVIYAAFDEYHSLRAYLLLEAQ